jgi:hypothetical protein
MYALFMATPLVGHLNPLIRQAEELRRRGWRVAVASLRELGSHVAAESPDLPFILWSRLKPAPTVKLVDCRLIVRKTSTVRERVGKHVQRIEVVLRLHEQAMLGLSFSSLSTFQLTFPLLPLSSRIRPC